VLRTLYYIREGKKNFARENGDAIFLAALQPCPLLEPDARHAFPEAAFLQESFLQFPEQLIE